MLSDPGSFGLGYTNISFSTVSRGSRNHRVASHSPLIGNSSQRLLLLLSPNVYLVSLQHNYSTKAAQATQNGETITWTFDAPLPPPGAL